MALFRSILQHFLNSPATKSHSANDHPFQDRDLSALTSAISSQDKEIDNISNQVMDLSNTLQNSTTALSQNLNEIANELNFANTRPTSKWDFFMRGLEISNIILTLVITFVSVYVAHTANQINERQYSLSAALASPVIVTEPIYSEEDNTICGITITNRGTMCQNFYVELLPFICIEFSDKDYFQELHSVPSHTSYCQIQIPIGSKKELYQIDNTYSQVGELALISESDSLKLYTDTLKTYASMLRKQNTTPRVVALSLQYYLSVSYDDILGNPHTATYHCVTGYSESATAIYEIPMTAYANSSYSPIRDEVTALASKYAYLSNQLKGTYHHYERTDSEIYDYFQSLIDSYMSQLSSSDFPLN